MSLVHVGNLNVPNYTALSTDIADGKVTGASNVGQVIYFTDTNLWKVIKPDLTLADYGIQVMNAVPVTVAIAGYTVPLASVEITRPSDGNAYIALDSVNTSTSSATYLTFAAAGRAVGGTGHIISAQGWTDQVACTATFRLWLFSVAPTPWHDNDPYQIMYADIASTLGYIDIGPMWAEGSGSTAAYQQNGVPGIPYKCAAADTALYGLVETLTAFTPASGQKFTFRITVEQN